MVKREVCRLLGCSDRGAEGDWARLPALKTVNALFSFLYSTDPQVKWCAVRAMGKAAARLADEDLEAARNVVRRLMWSLNDESGGIGWGAGEALGEILARHAGLAQEYAHILLSYARRDGNLLDHDGLLQGVLWGLTRIAQTRPELLPDAARHIAMHLHSSDASIRAVELWACWEMPLCGVLSMSSPVIRAKSPCFFEIANNECESPILSPELLIAWGENAVFVTRRERAESLVAFSLPNCDCCLLSPRPIESKRSVP
jgi:hypothetical protein